MRSFFLFLSFLATVGCYRVSEALNEQLQDKCGRQTYQRKVINGAETYRGEHPWAASLYIRYNGSVMIGPATIISPRHLIAFNLVRDNQGYHSILKKLRISGTVLCEGVHLLLPQKMLSAFDIDFEYLSPLNASRKFRDSVNRITVINGCSSLGNDKLMVIELRESLRITRNRRPVCVSNSAKNWDPSLHAKFPVYGVNRTGILVTAEFAPVLEGCDAKVPLSCAKAVRQDQGLCQGDFGGAAVATVNEHATVLGIYAKGNIKCGSDPATINDYQFINIGYYREGICEVTGVCAAAPDNDVTTVPPVITSTVVSNATETPEVTFTSVGNATYVTEAPEVGNVTEVATSRPNSTQVPEIIVTYVTEVVTSQPNSTVIPETTSTGATVIDLLNGTLTAETFERLSLNASCGSESDSDSDGSYSGHVKDIHIHIHLDGRRKADN
ncbi:unnamed protein product [Caenorhabditis sp. 36 PRJEB53466]|nr:unnamed protein product [Caenorhabditis sp. 36 PRJEB53466]